MKANIFDFKDADKTQYNSLVDEYRRFKFFRMKRKFKNITDDELFDLLCHAVRHMFKLRRTLVEGLEFGLKVKDTFTKYVLKEISPEAKYIMIAWDVENDHYKLEFKIDRVWLQEKAYNLKFKQSLQREETFFGLSDMIGTYVYRKAFKLNMKTFVKYINHLITHAAEIDHSIPLY